MIDLRSDTVTQPCQEMRIAMFNAVVGDDSYSEDDTVNRLEQEVADLLGKQAALLLPAGRMGNLIAIMNYCKGPSAEAIVGSISHINVHESSTAAQIAGVQLVPLANQPDGTLRISDIMCNIKKPHAALNQLTETALICLENTQNYCGGVCLPLEYMDQINGIKQSYGIPVHLDGARVFNAAVALGVDPKEVVKHCDSVMVSLSKSLGAPIGSLLVGSTGLIEYGRRMRKLLGGGMNQAGVIAAPGLVAITKGYRRLHEDHSNARFLAAGINDTMIGFIYVKTESIATNILIIHLQKGIKITVDWVVESLRSVEGEFGQPCVRVLAVDEFSFRAVTNNGVSKKDIIDVLAKLRRIVAVALRGGSRVAQSTIPKLLSRDADPPQWPVTNS